MRKDSSTLGLLRPAKLAEIPGRTSGGTGAPAGFPLAGETGLINCPSLEALAVPTPCVRRRRGRVQPVRPLSRFGDRRHPPDRLGPSAASPCRRRTGNGRAARSFPLIPNPKPQIRNLKSEILNLKSQI